MEPEETPKKWSAKQRKAFRKAMTVAATAKANLLLLHSHTGGYAEQDFNRKFTIPPGQEQLSASLSEAVKSDNVEQIKLLVSQIADELVHQKLEDISSQVTAQPSHSNPTASPGQEGRSSLYEAVALGDIETIKLLLTQVANDNAEDNATNIPSVSSAHNSNSFSCAQRKRISSLHEAVRLRDIEKVKVLLSQKADVTAEDPYKNTPLHYVALKPSPNNVAIAELLLNVPEVKNSSSYINNSNKFGRTPLLMACCSGDLELAKLFIKHGVDVNYQGEIRLSKFDKLILDLLESITPKRSN